MKIQKSFIEKKSTLYLVPTPIGNLGDMTYRAVEVLNDVDFIFSEDTRVTKVLLSHFNITTPLSSYHIYNEEEQANEILNLLRQGKNIALVSDAGLPCISDPGFLVSREAIDNGYHVVSLPGANAATTALIASGIPSDKFFFFGFLPSKKTQRVKQLHQLIDIKETIIFYEAPHRIIHTLNDMLTVFGNREVVVARELTKKYEEYIRGPLQDIVDAIVDLKGEIVIIVRGSEHTQIQEQLLHLDIKEHYNYYIKLDIEHKEAMKKVAQDRNISKSDVYRVVNDISAR